MIPIGNDIIDLLLAKKESNIFRKGYLEKILTENELKILLNSKDIELSFWQMWSMKEAVYKILRQKEIERGYYPKKIEVLASDFNYGKVIYDHLIYYTKTKIYDNYLETIALEDFNQFKNIVVLHNNTKLNKTNEIPFIEINNNKYFVSKSHHGRFENMVTFL